MSKVAARVHISGGVQGVFFRQTTAQMARIMGVCGWVRNIPDGRVEALFEGSKESVEEMIKWCWEGPPMARVDNVRVEWVEPKGYEDFRIESGRISARKHEAEDGAVANTAAHVYISGGVQGVFYRYSTEKKAKVIGLCGWVRNLSDGRVEAFFEGPKESVEEMIKWCWEGPPMARVDNVRVEWVEPKGYEDFKIAY